MPLLYKRLFPEFEYHYEHLLGDSQVLFFDPAMEKSAKRLSDRYRALDISLRNADSVIFRGTDHKLIDNLEGDSVLKNLLADTPVAALVGGYDANNLNPSIIHISWSKSVPQYWPSIDFFREIEILSILERKFAIFRGGDLHFILPSGCHAAEFVRLADGLCERTEVLRITDWIFAYIRPQSAILCDTGSALPLLLMLQQEAHRRFGWSLPIETLDEYPAQRPSLAETVNELVAKTSPDGHLLFLISINSTGRLAKLMRSVAPIDHSIVIICNTDRHLPAEATSALTNYPIDRWLVEEDGSCNQCRQSTPIGIDPHTYERLPTLRWNRVPVRHTEAEGNRSFWEAVDQAEAVRLHVDMEYTEHGIVSSRHFPVYLDTERLIEQVDFREKCLTKLRSIRLPDIILIPQHRASAGVQSLVLRAFPASEVCVIPRTGSLDVLEEKLAAASRILIADDTIITGRTLIGLRREIYRVTQRLRINPTIDVFVLIARPDRKEVLLSVKRPYRDSEGDHLVFGEQIYLPAPGNENCPWCEEYRWLSSYIRDLSGTALEYIRERMRKLEGELFPPLLLGTEDDDVAGLATQGSFFGTIRQSTAFAAASSTAQAKLFELATTRNGSVIDIIDVPMVISAYFEAVFVAAILRTFQPVQLRYVGQDRLVEEQIRRLDLARTYPGTIPELAWAAVTGRIPKQAVIGLLSRVVEEEQNKAIALLHALLSIDN